MTPNIVIYLADDLGEQRNLLADRPAVVKEMKLALAAWARDVETQRLPPYWL